MPNSSFYRFCETVQHIAELRGSNAKIKACSEYLNSLEDEVSLQLAVRYLGEGAFSSVSGKRASVGHRTIAVCAADFCEIDYDIVFKPSRQATGSSSETIEKLMENLDIARSKRQPTYPSLQEIDHIYQELEQTRGREAKQTLLKETWGKLTPLEIKYFIRIMGQGSLRIGFESRSIVTAMARAFNQDVEKTRYVHMITGSLEKAALLCARDNLDSAQFTLFQPLAFMLASPLESRSIEQIENYIAEEKFDGMRCQLHADGEHVAFFSRDLNDITKTFPELTDYFSNRNLPASVLDGEICVFKDGNIRPFQELQKRMGVKKPTETIRKKYPVLFIAYDLLFWDGSPLFEKPLTERRKKLSEVCKRYSIAVTHQYDISDVSDVEKLFNQSISRGNEGLMLKLKDSEYEYGQRRKSWLKVKKPGGSLDTVIMYAHAGSGKRGGTYSDFTLGIRVADDDRYEEEFIPIGKSYGGYTNEELKWMNQEIKKLAVDRFGPTLSLKPGIVVEIEFDDIQINKRTKAGYTLRLPRFKAIRKDLHPRDCDTLKDVERIMNEKLAAADLPSDGIGFVLPG